MLHRLTGRVADSAVTQYILFSANEGRKRCVTFKDLLKYIWDGDFHNVYPDLFKLVRICAAIPITSSECDTGYVCKNTLKLIYFSNRTN